MPLSITKADLSIRKLAAPATRSLLTLPAVALLIAAGSVFVHGGASRAIQAPRMTLDMIPDGNTYDEATNTMIVGPLDNCLGADPPGNNAVHNHTAHIIIQGVEDLVGWQARLNYDGGLMRPLNVNFSPFPDTARGQNISFTNLPIDPGTGVHHDLLPGQAIPPAAPGPQTALVGATYLGQHTAPISPDTPPKAPPDDTTYNAPNGGVLAALTLQVQPGQAGQGLLTMDLDDGDPNAPGSKIVVFDGSSTKDILLAESEQFDGYHAEGGACVPPVTVPPAPPGVTPGVGPGATATAPPPGSSPGAEASGSPARTLRPGETPPGSSPSITPSPGGAANNPQDGNGGTSTWVFLLIAGAVAALSGAAFAAWRYRSRLPWFKGGG